jgi:uncharacterized membrane protein YraQ (UPF0718 family)
MLMPTLVMAALALILMAIGYGRGDGSHLAGAKSGLMMMLQIVPLLVFAFLMAGMIQVLVPRELVSRWLGAESGWKGILIGCVAGGVMPGGPYVSLPLVAGLLKSGVGVGTGVAFLTSWALWAGARLPMEVGILGPKFTLIRLASTFLFPPIAGWIAQTFFKSVNIGI